MHYALQEAILCVRKNILTALLSKNGITGYNVQEK
jgi:hypothetical protein